MFDETLITASKLLSLAIFFPIYVGAVAYACWTPKLEAFARIPLQED